MLHLIRFDYGHGDCMSFQPRNKHRLLRSARPLGSAPHARVFRSHQPTPPRSGPIRAYALTRVCRRLPATRDPAFFFPHLS
jgi:hypothetical protein